MIVIFNDLTRIVPSHFFANLRMGNTPYGQVVSPLKVCGLLFLKTCDVLGVPQCHDGKCQPIHFETKRSHQMEKECSSSQGCLHFCKLGPENPVVVNKVIPPISKVMIPGKAPIYLRPFIGAI